jgi:hypothetical protein
MPVPDHRGCAAEHTAIDHPIVAAAAGAVRGGVAVEVRADRSAMTLALPGTEVADANALICLVPDPLNAATSKSMYRRALLDFLQWYQAAGAATFDRAAVQCYRALLLEAGLSLSTINQKLSAIRALASACQVRLGSRARRVRPGALLMPVPHSLRFRASLGHASIRTTDRYLGVEQDLTDAPCDGWD